MKGHLRQRGPNTWLLFWDLPKGPDGKRRQKTKTVHGGKREAQRELSRLITEAQSADRIEPTTQTVEAYLLEWLEAHRSRVSVGTAQTYADCLRIHILPALGHHRLAKLTALQIQAFYTHCLRDGRKDGKPGGLSLKSVHLYHRLLKAALSHAVKMRLLTSNPCDLVQLPTPPKKRFPIYTPEQVELLLESIRDDPHTYLAVLVGILTGLRKGEVAGLKWSAINWQQKTLSVTESLNSDRSVKGYHALGPPKSAASVRDVAVPDSLLEAFAAHRARQNEEKALAREAYQDQGFVFAWPDGRFLSPVTLLLRYQRACQKVGLPVIRFHDLRHSHVAILILKGVPLKAISERLGHSSIQMTMDIYGHLLPGIQEGAAAALGEMFRGVTDPKPGSEKGNVSTPLAEPRKRRVIRAVPRTKTGENPPAPDP